MKSKTLNKGISCATNTAWTSQYVTISISRTEKKPDYKTWISTCSYFWSFSFQLRGKKPYLRTNFSFIRCITGSKNSSPRHQSSTSFGPSRRIDLQPPTCPLPGSWWKDKAGIRTPITSSSPSPHAPLSCPPLATNPFSSVSVRICLWEGSIADREQKRGNRSRSKRN